MAQPPLTYTLVVTSAVYGEQGGSTALRFASALLEAGHRLHTVFFYQGGVSHSSQLVAPAADEFDIHQAWCKLALRCSCEMAVCVAAAERRGILDCQVAQQHGKEHYNLDEPFRSAGLGEMAVAILESDRVIQL